MNLIDAIIILIICYCAFMGFRRGLTKELVSFIGVFLIIIVSFILKNPISQFMYENLPFFTFGGIFKGVTALNIIVYEVLAFFIVLSLATVVFKVLLFATSVFEKILKLTIVLGIPSKILGMITGIVEGFTWAFILLYILSLPVFNISSSLKKPILENTPILSNFTNNFNNVILEFSSLKEEYEEKDNTKEFNYKTMELLLKYKIITTDSALKLEEKGKLKIDDIDSLIEKYEEDTNGKIEQ